MLAERVLGLNSHLLGFVYENIISSSHSTDSVKRNGISKKKRGITLPTVAKLKGRVNFAAHKGLLNDFLFFFMSEPTRFTYPQSNWTAEQNLS